MTIPHLPFDLQPFAGPKETYIVGGTVRDLLLGRHPADVDISVAGDPEAYAHMLVGRTGGHVVSMGRADLALFRVISNGGRFDISQMQGPIAEDLGRRDFTVNAMAIAVPSGDLIDPYGGEQDLARRMIRMNRDSAFRADPVRLLRAFRMASDLGFELGNETRSAILRDSHLIRHAAGERIRDELLKMLRGERSYPCLIDMSETGLLFSLLPELQSLEDVEQNRHHAFNGFTHTTVAYRRLEEILEDPERYSGPFGRQIKGLISGKRAALLKCALLFHDTGKPEALSIDKNGDAHFYGHARSSSRIADAAFSRLRFSNKERSHLDRIIRNHDRPLSLFVSKGHNVSITRGITRLFMTCDTHTPDLLIHSMADQAAKGNRGSGAGFTVFMREMLDVYYRKYLACQKQPPLVTGDDLIKRFNLVPSPVFKDILNAVEEARLSGVIAEKAEAYALVQLFLDGMSGDRPSR